MALKQNHFARNIFSTLINLLATFSLAYYTDAGTSIICKCNVNMVKEKNGR